jgi:hypothetical protein
MISCPISLFWCAVYFWAKFKACKWLFCNHIHCESVQ